VFTVQGNVNILSISPPINYIIDRLKIITLCSDATIDTLLGCVRNTTDERLADILFKSVAGDYTVGSGTLQQNTCRITTDPITGYLSIIDQTQENRVVMTIIIIILFIVLGYIITKQKNNNNTINTPKTTT
jgi:hypothetical protein